MKQKKSINIGWRGWILVIYQFTAMIASTTFNNYPMNALAGTGMYGGQQLVSSISSIGFIIGIILQIILANRIGKLKSVKRFSVGLGIADMILAFFVMTIPPTNQNAWIAAYFLFNILICLWATFSVGVLIGQWFPRRKGTIMGIATFAFPVGNALLSPFASVVFAGMAKNGKPNLIGGFLPFFIVCCIGLLLAAIFIKDYPEQVGAFRDNDKTVTPEIARKMMEEEIENKKTTVWTVGHTIKSPDFWLMTIPMGLMLLGSVGAMTQTTSIIGSYGYGPDTPQFGMIMLANAVLACVGSFALGLIDTKFGTKKAMIIAFIFMIAAGVLGAVQSFGTLVAAMMFLAVFMGASSNFTVSGSVQYWRREDFPSVFGVVNPVANLIQAVAPVLFAILITSVGGQASKTGVSRAFLSILIAAVISLIMIVLFKPGRVKAYDDRYREAAGKPLDDALEGRK